MQYLLFSSLLFLQFLRQFLLLLLLLLQFPPPLGFCLSAYLGGEVVVGGDLDCELGGDAEEGRSESLPGSERAFSPEGHVETIRGSTIQANTIPAVTKNNIHTQTRGMILIERREKIPHNTMRWTSKTPTTHDTTHQNAVSQ